MFRRTLGLVLACCLLSVTQTLFAGSGNSGELLVNAYATLERADHDYKGHRIDAMKQVEAAGKLLGVNVRGDGRGHEKQGVSDEQLRTAQGMLEAARQGLSGKALRHVNRAIEQINVALRIK